MYIYTYVHVYTSFMTEVKTYYGPHILVMQSTEFTDIYTVYVILLIISVLPRLFWSRGPPQLLHPKSFDVAMGVAYIL